MARKFAVRLKNLNVPEGTETNYFVGSYHDLIHTKAEQNKQMFLTGAKGSFHTDPARIRLWNSAPAAKAGYEAWNGRYNTVEDRLKKHGITWDFDIVEVEITVKVKGETNE